MQASESHLADCRFRHLSPATLALYEEYERSFLDWCAQHGSALQLRELNATNVREFANYIRGRRGGKRNGEFAARAAVSTLKTWSRFLVDEEVLEADYLSRLRLPKTTLVARQAYQSWEIQALRGAMAENATSTRDVAMLSFLIDTGIRVGELVTLRLGDLDLQARRVTVYGKGRVERVIPFGNSEARDGGGTVRRLRAYLAIRHPRRDLPASDRERLFLSFDGRALGTEGVRAMFDKAARIGEVSHHEVHSTRHTFAVRYLVKNPGDIEGLRYVLGHLSSDMYRTYAGQAGVLIAEVAGRESIADAMFSEEAGSPKVRLLRSNGSVVNRNGVGPPSGVTLNDPALPNRRREDRNRAASQAPRGDRRLPG